jgi:hypothetical protein
MTSANTNTPVVKLQTQPKHVVTRNTLGQLICTCRGFRANVALYGQGSCLHTQKVAALQDVH